MKIKNLEKGITLLALVITIIVLLILAGVTISIAMRTGIMDKAEKSVDLYTEQEVLEEVKLDLLDYKTDGLLDKDNRDLKKFLTDQYGSADEAADPKYYEITVKGYIFWVNKSTLEVISQGLETGPVPTIDNVEKVKLDGDSFVTVTVTASPVNGGNLTITINGDNVERTEDKTKFKITRNGTYTIVVQEEGVRRKAIRTVEVYELIEVPNESDIICVLKNKSENDTKGIVEIGSTRTFEGWNLSYTKNDGTKTEITQGITIEIDVVKNDYIEVVYSKSGQTDVIKSYRVTELKIEYTLNYDATEGTGAPVSQTQYDNTTFTISSNIPTRDEYIFEGWSMNADRTGTVYSAGETITVSNTTTLYAIWNYRLYLFNQNIDLFTNTWTGGGSVASNKELDNELCKYVYVNDNIFNTSVGAFFCLDKSVVDFHNYNKLVINYKKIYSNVYTSSQLTLFGPFGAGGMWPAKDYRCILERRKDEEDKIVEMDISNINNSATTMWIGCATGVDTTNANSIFINGNNVWSNAQDGIIYAYIREIYLCDPK